MFGNIFRNKKISLAERCQKYLELGPPKHMGNYVSGSITEIIISNGAQELELNDELKEIASIILMETDAHEKIENLEIRQYMLLGKELVRAVLKNS